MSRIRILPLLGLVTAAALAGRAPAAAAPFQVQGIFQFVPAHFALAFTDSVNINNPYFN